MIFANLRLSSSLFTIATTLIVTTACVFHKSTDLETVAVDKIVFNDGEEIYFADPTIFPEGGKYYMTGTLGNSSLKGFVMLESTDLKNWTPVNGGSPVLGKVYGNTGFWAPQIYKNGTKYYFFYTANEQVAVANSSNIVGPYVQDSVRPIDGSAKNIDPFLFKDDDGKYYLYHVRFNRGNYLWVAEFDMATGNIDKATLKQCLDYTDKWEKTDDGKWDPIMEGPTVVKLDGSYYLLYSANHFLNPDYAMGYATSASPLGPWVKHEGNPVIHRSIVGENGSGHGDFFYGYDGKPYYVYHVHNNDSIVSPRKTRIVPLVLNKNDKTELLDISIDSVNIIIPRINGKQL